MNKVFRGMRTCLHAAETDIETSGTMSGAAQVSPLSAAWAQRTNPLTRAGAARELVLWGEVVVAVRAAATPP